MEDFKQLCVWPATIVGADKKDEFELFMFETFRVRVKYCEDVVTLPSLVNGERMENTGGRNDAFFFIHNDDISTFAVPRLQVNIRWWEDVIRQNYDEIYPAEIIAKYPVTW